MLKFYRFNNLSSVLNSLTLRLSVRLSHSLTCTRIPTHSKHIDNIAIKHTQEFGSLNRFFHSSANSWKKKSEMYPPIEPFNVGHLEVSSVHKIYYEQCGNQNGLPIIFVHG